MILFDYEDVRLLPRKCVVASRSECDTSLILGRHEFRLPIVPANMRAVIDEDIAIWLAENNYFYIMHRFDVDSVEFCRRMAEKGLVSSISCGIKPADYDLINKMAQLKLKVDFITIDIAHGHADSMRKMIQHIKLMLPDTFVIAGNVATPEAVLDLEAWGADCVKVGVGPGKVCTTRLKTGFGTGGWQLGAIKLCSAVAKKPIIADGGVKYHGDIAKAIHFGASLVMAGAIFAGHIESPGNTLEVDGKKFKEYFGSASYQNKGEKKHVEGKGTLIVMKGHLSETLKEIQEDLQSAISYSGGTTLSDLTTCGHVVRGAITASVQGLTFASDSTTICREAPAQIKPDQTHSLPGIIPSKVTSIGV